ncbi:LysR substrate-binding domain-containing protein [Desulfovibrio subterraneus]|uniref:LysR substrate-binding domain-containing protein n=1 Tax=Desulfovibrio subterraneus TaxID=2718620 RepID=UPI0022B86840|nr:LysR substrate-binding domain-containing protein [Desulfovibrio subterraneus]WBF67347.1 LysR substrate-binding domain-containing protein [Desulfovibrio subterraneus]
MELRLMEQFVAVAETLHFGRAAERLHMSQPPLSMAMQRLEGELGVTLLERNRRGVRLTAAGEVFLAEVRQVLAGAQRAMTLTRRTARGEAGMLRLGCMGPAVAAGLPALVHGFRQQHPDVRILLEEQVSVRQLAMLRDGALDLAVVRLHGELPAGMQVRLLFRDEYVAAVPQSHPSAAKEMVRMEDMRDDSLILYPRSMGAELYDAVIAACHGAGFSPRIEQEVATKSTTLALVAAGLGVAFVPASLARAGYAGVSFVPLQSALPVVEMYGAWLAGCTNPVVERFMEYALHSAQPCI